jgi:DNA-directed RNA polymerase sigma subunit (sigma70/sigma32)
MYAHKEDVELINIVKDSKAGASQAMTEIIKRHSGIFIEMVNHFVPCNSPYCDKKEMIEEKSYHIYRALLKYDENKGTKFSTHLGNEAKWLCLNTYNKAKSKSTFTSSDQDFDKEQITEPFEAKLNQESYKNVVKIIEEFNDKRVTQIFKMRYIEGEGNKVTPWRKISERLNMSIQGCINIHNSAVEKIKKRIEK